MYNKINQILVLLVTCSRDETRRDLAVRVVQNLSEKLSEASLQNDFMLFDNGSIYKDHLAYAPQGTRIVQSEENTGYWSAIKWVLDNYQKVMGKDYQYIYLVESDLYHTDLKGLNICTEFLDKTPTAACVRTQEFLVKYRWRFDKALQFLPFHITRSEITLKNLVDGCRAWFTKTDMPPIYLSNLHAKLPALNRISAMKICFDALSKMENFKEGDFFSEMFKLYPIIGVYDGGLFYSLFSQDDKKVISGSYTNNVDLQKTGYQQTRYAKIILPLTNLKITKV